MRKILLFVPIIFIFLLGSVSLAAIIPDSLAAIIPDPVAEIIVDTVNQSNNGTDQIIIPAMTIDSTGNIGIGTSTPAEKLHVVGKILTQNPSNSTIAIGNNMTMWTDATKSYIYSYGDKDGLYLKSNTGDKVILQSDLYLDVDKTVYLEGIPNWITVAKKIMSFDSTSAGDPHRGAFYLYAPNNYYASNDTPPTIALVGNYGEGGSVGIGTSTPKATLDVRGDILAIGVLKGNSTIGGNAGEIQGYATSGKPAKFAFKYDSSNNGDTSNAIQIWNAETGVYKTFIINHPLYDEKYLIHAAIEGPESAVYYRGESSLYNGTATIVLPEYFEALTLQENQTIQLTAKGQTPFLLSYSTIVDGAFTVYGTIPDGEFSWEVKAVRADGEKLNDTVNKDDIDVFGDGPYKYYAKKVTP